MNISEVSLKEHIEKIIALEVLHIRDNIVLAKEDVERRLHAMNELRRQIESERGTFITKDWFEKTHGLLQAQVSSLESERGTFITKDWFEKMVAPQILTLQNKQANADGRRITWSAVVVVVNLIISGLALYFLRK